VKEDYLGKEINIGDTVVFMQIGYRGLMKGTIVSMAEKKAKIKHEKTNIGRTESIQFYGQMIKIEE
jgi:hypothetical protein